jgi:hypothetical protein
MLAIWIAVQREIHIWGARSVRQACEQLFYVRAGTLIKFTDERGYVIDVIKGVPGAATLRQRYQVAECCRHNAEKYPILHARAAQLERELPQIGRKRRERAEDDLRVRNGVIQLL